MRWAIPILALSLALGAPEANAFCGFYVSGGGTKIFNNATQVVMMREGTLTVLSMQNNYQGPPKDFALVVPVPVVLKKSNVKTLPMAAFDKLDRLDSPRLVEYWEQDPCKPPRVPTVLPSRPKAMPSKMASADSSSGRDYGVTVEAQFKVGEYEIVILSAKESTGLDAYLRDSGYKIPEGAEAVLKPYVEAGMKFFVAKVDTTKVKFDDEENARLSPLRFHYDSESFSLPVRLGLLNSNGAQDLIVHIFAKERYEAANYKNVTIPTNFDVDDAVKQDFGPFYAALFDETLEENPGAVVTEYAWTTNFSSEGGNASCDPCPTNPPGQAEILSLGADILRSTIKTEIIPYDNPRFNNPKINPFPLFLSQPRFNWLAAPSILMTPGVGGFFYEIQPKVLTRLHVRYTKDSLGEDLVFQKAAPIAGGRENRTDGVLEAGASDAKKNFFQARYAIRHPWTGPVNCEKPKFGRWGLPPRGVKGDNKPASAVELAFVARDKLSLADMIKGDVPGLNLKRPAPASTSAPTASSAPTAASAPSSQPLSVGGGKPQAPTAATAQESTNPWLLPVVGVALLLLALFLVSRKKGS